MLSQSSRWPRSSFIEIIDKLDHAARGETSASKRDSQPALLRPLLPSIDEYQQQLVLNFKVDLKS